MSKFSLHAGLMLRRGQTTLEIVRQLDDTTFQIEDCVTRRPSTLDRLEILKRIWSKFYEIVLPVGAEAPSSKSQPPDFQLDLASLKEEVRKDIEYKRKL